MRALDQISQHLQCIDLSKFNNNYEEACLFYYGLLRDLKLRHICTQVQIENGCIPTGARDRRPSRNGKHAKEGSELQQNKQHRQPCLEEGQPIDQILAQAPGSLEQQWATEGIFRCSVKGCSKEFGKKTALQHHEVLRHSTSPADWVRDRVFNIEIRNKEEGSTGGRRGSRH